MPGDVLLLLLLHIGGGGFDLLPVADVAMAGGELEPRCGFEPEIDVRCVFRTPFETCRKRRRKVTLTHMNIDPCETTFEQNS